MDCGQVSTGPGGEVCCDWYFEANTVKECEEAAREHMTASGHPAYQIRGTRCISFPDAPEA